MAWITGVLSQNGNSVFTWTVSGPTQGLFDTIAVGRLSGSSSLMVESIVAVGNTYLVRVRTFGPQAISYQIRGGPVP